MNRLLVVQVLPTLKDNYNSNIFKVQSQIGFLIKIPEFKIPEF
jgi:hypothetical protein